LYEEISEETLNSAAKRKQVHELYLRAINNPLRRKILSVLKENNFTIEELAVYTCLDEFTLRWHLNVLERGLCVEKEDNKGNILYKLNPIWKSYRLHGMNYVQIWFVGLNFDLSLFLSLSNALPLSLRTFSHTPVCE